MKLKLKDVAWSPLRSREQLRHHESPIARRGRKVEPTLIVASLDLDDEEWAAFATNLLRDYPWLEGQGGREKDHRKAVQVRGPERTIYVDPDGSASGVSIGFSVKEQACSISHPLPKKNSPPATTGERVGPGSLQEEGHSEAPPENRSDALSAEESGDVTPTPAKSAEQVVETAVPVSVAAVQRTTAPAALPASTPTPAPSENQPTSESSASIPDKATTEAPSSSDTTPQDQMGQSSTSTKSATSTNPTPSSESGSVASTQEESLSEEEQTRKRLKRLLDLLDDDSTAEDW